MQERHELSTTDECMRLDRCQHILNLMKDETVPNLVFTDEKKFDVQESLNHQHGRVWSRDGSVEGCDCKPMPESDFCDCVTGNHSHWEITLFCTLRSETEQPVLHFGHFES